MEASATEPYSVTSHFLHYISSRQRCFENRLQLVCNIHEAKTSMATSASVIQLNHYYEGRALFCSKGLLPPSPVTHTQTHTQGEFFYTSSIRVCIVWECERLFISHKEHIHTDTHKLTYIVMHTNTRKTLVCQKLASSQLVLACVLATLCTFSVTHLHHLIFHQQYLSADIIH